MTETAAVATGETSTDSTARRYTITVTPLTPDELSLLIGDIRARFGRKPLVHVIGDQPSGTHIADAPGASR